MLFDIHSMNPNAVMQNAKVYYYVMHIMQIIISQEVEQLFFTWGGGGGNDFYKHTIESIGSITR